MEKIIKNPGELGNDECQFNKIYYKLLDNEKYKERTTRLFSGVIIVSFDKFNLKIIATDEGYIIAELEDKNSNHCYVSAEITDIHIWELGIRMLNKSEKRFVLWDD